MTKKCNQIRCPVDCVVGAWSNFDKCTKECGGGVQTRTRNQTVKPKNGGKACEALMETQACGTGACDTDCKLGEWAPWGQCSQTCASGYAARQKTVLEEPKGAGV